MTTAQNDEAKRIILEAEEAVRRIQNEVNTIYGLMAGELGEVDGLSDDVQVMAVDFATTTSAWFEKFDPDFRKLRHEVTPPNDNPEVVFVPINEQNTD